MLEFLIQFISTNTTWAQFPTYDNGYFVGSTWFPSYGFYQAPLNYIFILLVALFYVSPFLLSLALTKNKGGIENLRVVPPRCITAIVLIFAVLFILGAPNFGLSGEAAAQQENNYSFALIGLMVFGMAGVMGEDGLAVRVLGRGASREQIYFEKLLVHNDIETVKGRLIVPEIRKNLNLKPTVEGSKEEGYTLDTSSRRFDKITKIRLEKFKENDGWTTVSVVHYLISTFYLKVDIRFIEVARKDSAYIYDVLTEREPKLPTDIILPLSNSHHDLFIDRALDDLRGYYARTQRAPSGEKALLAIFALVLVLLAYLVISGEGLLALAAGLIEALLGMVEIGDRLKKRG